MTREVVFATLSTTLQDMFDVPAARITEQARLYQDLDLDSIDAIDLVVKLQELTGRKIRPEQFKSARTVGDVVDHVQALLRD
jgi:acyl carrier protein